MSMFMVERELKGISMDALAAAQKAAISEAQTTSQNGTPVTYLHSTFVPGDGRCMCLFEADDAGAVENVNQRANIPYTKVTEVLHLPPQD